MDEETKLPWSHDYTMTVSIGFSGAERTGVVDPARDSIYSEDEWNALSRHEQEDWLRGEVDDFASNCVESRWSL